MAERNTNSSVKTQIDFTHAGIMPEAEYYENCNGRTNYLRAVLLQPLKTGKGQPK